METPLERLARINKNLNLSLSQVRENDFSAETFRSPSISSRTRSVGFEKNSVRYIDDKSDNSDDGLVRKTSMTSISKVLMNVGYPNSAYAY